jgi:hypothetical protein
MKGMAHALADRINTQPPVSDASRGILLGQTAATLSQGPRG